MKRYAFTSLASKVEIKTPAHRVQVNTHGTWVTMGILEADNKDEAVGKALRISLKLYPQSEGWHDHKVSAIDTSEPPVTPETAVLRNT